MFGFHSVSLYLDKTPGHVLQRVHHPRFLAENRGQEFRGNVVREPLVAKTAKRRTKFQLLQPRRPRQEKSAVSNLSVAKRPR